ncbi:MAG: GIY-YIG nuclease family protein [Flavobacteriaceae bacterium]|nr:GIY-YIG nuclease family protein [Flavobacteriaceae bacterium]
MYFIYILYSESFDKYYVGYSTSPAERLIRHNTQDYFHTFTSKYRPWSLKAVFEVSESEGDAVNIERFIKNQKSRKLIEKLCDPEFVPTGKLAQLVRVPYVRD